jgi:hypothetical protein
VPQRHRGDTHCGSGRLARRNWPGLTRRASEKTACLAGLLADLAPMVLLIASWLVVHQHAAAFALLLVATACLGAGFGLTVPPLNTLAAAFHPAAVAVPAATAEDEGVEHRAG